MAHSLITQWSRLKPRLFGKNSRVSNRVMRLRLLQSLVVLWIEFLWSCAWPLFLVPAVFSFCAVVGLTPSHPWAHLAWLVGFSLALTAAAFYLAIFVRDQGIPNPARARRRLDHASGLAHHPLSSLADRPAAPAGQAALAAALWRYHLDRLAATLGRIPILYPQSPPHRGAIIGGRALLVVMAIFAIAVWHGPEERVRERLIQALVPNFSDFSPRPVLDVWVDPPSYMNRSPLVLASADGAIRRDESQIIEVPVGGQAWIRAFGVVTHAAEDDADTLLTARLGDQEQVLNRAGDIYETSFPYQGETILEVLSDGEILDSWRFAPIPDQIPEITMPRPPQPSRRLALRLDYEAHDDHRVEGVWAEIRPVESHSEDTLLSIPLSPGGKSDVAGLVHRDLTPHPWAGQKVEIRLKAKDSLDQTATTAPVALVLPERVFTHPLAQEIIVARKQLIQDPAAAPMVAENLGSIADQLRQSAGDRTIFLGLQRVQNQLLKADKMDSVIALLWDLALRLEDGSLGSAERELRAAQEALEEALANNASLDEIDRLTQRLRTALSEFLRQLARSETTPDESSSSGDMVTEKSLEELLDQARDLAHLGARSAAQQLLSQLRATLENIENSAQNGNQATSGAMMEALQRLGDTARTQEELLNRGMDRQRQGTQRQETQRQDSQRQDGQRQGSQGQTKKPESQPEDSSRSSLGQSPNQDAIRQDAERQENQRQNSQRRGSQGQTKKPESQPEDSSRSSLGQSPNQDAIRQDAERQENLRRQLGELMLDFDDQMGAIPSDLGQAERAMRDAARALQRQFSQEQSSTGDPNDALDPQNQALQALREAEQSIASAMTQNSGLSQGRQSLGNDQLDPFGRRLGDQDQPSLSYQEIPDKAAMGKAYEVLRELRRRASDPQRSDSDRAYIDRLIPQF